MLLHFKVTLASLSWALNNAGNNNNNNNNNNAGSFPLLICIVHRGDKAYDQL